MVAFVGAEVYHAALDAGGRAGNVGGEVIGGVVGGAVVEVGVVACVHCRAAFGQTEVGGFFGRIGAGKDDHRFGRCHGVFLRQVGLRWSPVDLVVARTASDEVVLYEDVFFQIVDPKLVACPGVCGGISKKQAVLQGERAGLHAVRVRIGIYKSGQHAAAIAGGGVVVAGGVEDGAAGTKPDAGTVRGAIFGKNTVFYQSTDRIKISTAALAIGGISGESTPGEGGGLIEVYAGTGTADDIAIERTIGDRACPIQVGTAAAVCYLIAGEGTIGEGGSCGEKVRPATLVEGPVVHKSTLVEGGSRAGKIRPAARAVGGLIGGEDATGERGGRSKVRPGTLVFSPIVGEGTLGEGDGFGKVSTPAEIRITARVVGGIVAGEQAIYNHGARRSFACKKACPSYLKFGDQSCPALATGDGEPIEGGVCPGKLHYLQAVVGAGIVVGVCIFIRSRAGGQVIAEEVAGEDGGVGERAVGVAAAGVVGGVKSRFGAGKAAVDTDFCRDGETHFPLVFRGGGGVGGEGDGRVGAGFYPDLVADGGGAQGGGQRGGGAPGGAVAAGGAVSGDPQDDGGAHGDGLHDGRGGQIVVCIATLGGGDGGRAFGE